MVAPATGVGAADGTADDAELSDRVFELQNDVERGELDAVRTVDRVALPSGASGVHVDWRTGTVEPVGPATSQSAGLVDDPTGCQVRGALAAGWAIYPIGVDGDCPERQHSGGIAATTVTCGQEGGCKAVGFGFSGFALGAYEIECESEPVVAVHWPSDTRASGSCEVTLAGSHPHTWQTYKSNIQSFDGVAAVENLPVVSPP